MLVNKIIEMQEQTTTLSDEDNKVLLGLCIVYTICYVLMLALCFHNCLRYVLPMKMEYPQIWGFYLLAVLIYAFCVMEYAYYLANGVKAYQNDHDMYTALDLGSISYIVSDNLLKCLFALVTMTMYHLYLGLAFVNQQKSMEKVI